MKAYYEMTDAEKEIYEPMKAEVDMLRKELALYKFKSQLLEAKERVDSMNYEDVLRDIKWYYYDYENNYNCDLDYLVNKFSDETDLECWMQYIKDKFWISALSRAIDWLDDWDFHLFDDTYNRYYNIDDSDVDKLIEDLLSNLPDKIS